MLTVNKILLGNNKHPESLHNYLNIKNIIMEKILYHSYLKPCLKKNINRGFTLRELIIVITVTGAIPAVVMPWCLNHYDLLQQQTISKKLQLH